eukprot:TRINITY_DN2299_c0_g1_i1.p1 TRINITY_DN2299_c0_g1~~TRINITY_DN2299_c0_g1_i1.p1  ORF type:complete len:118 (-),score=0.30 TRINITY_DN2299_c0_g1_i1:29-382(-)
MPCKARAKQLNSSMETAQARTKMGGNALKSATNDMLDLRPPAAVLYKRKQPGGQLTAAARTREPPRAGLGLRGGTAKGLRRLDDEVYVPGDACDVRYDKRVSCVIDIASGAALLWCV